MIDSSLHKKLRSKYNPDGSPLRARQMRMLEMLKYVDRICKENNIKYWLSSGTCLGAVRHHGFIPWDDDVDIELLEDDYNKLIDILRKQENNEFVIQTNEDDPNYIFDFGKLRDKTTIVNESFGLDKLYKYQGLFIDIFKISPSNSKGIHYICGRIRTLENYLKLWSINHKTINYIFPIVRKINNSLFKIFYFFDKLDAKNKLRHTLGVPFLCPRYYEDIKDVIEIEFEGQVFPIPIGYKHYLKTMFGNYMELQITHSHFQLE